MKTVAIVALGAIAATTKAATCGLDVATIFLDAATSADAVACAKDTGISFAPNTKYTEADLKTVLATPSCVSYWDGVVKKVNAVKPACDFPSPLNDGSVLNTATFKWTLKDLFGLATSPSKNSTAGSNSTNSSATVIAAPTTTSPGASGANSSSAATNTSSTSTTNAPTTTAKSNAVVAAVSVAAMAVATMLA
ncbi:hypothetical protein LEN26_010029 [Aphanomyces euteiches]|nr:hypothetical protein AeMF1_012719 [Aphanomyces euteiches]KAH9123072.1 hypothetical protein LEN26_010029 [Aphanomyces euteiches]